MYHLNRIIIFNFVQDESTACLFLPAFSFWSWLRVPGFKACFPTTLNHCQLTIVKCQPRPVGVNCPLPTANCLLPTYFFSFWSWLRVPGFKACFPTTPNHCQLTIVNCQPRPVGVNCPLPTANCLLPTYFFSFWSWLRVPGFKACFPTTPN